MDNNSRIEIEKFKKHNFELWKLKMEDLLEDQEQWIFVNLGTTPIGMSTMDWDKIEWRARSTIRLCLANLMLLNVSGEELLRICGKSLETCISLSH